MTLALALRGSDGLVLAADSRVTGADGTADTSVKFLQINRELGVMTYGLAEPGYEAITRLYNEVNKVNKFASNQTKRTVHLSEIITLAGKIFKEEYDAWIENFKKTNEGMDTSGFSLGFILGGFDSNETNQFKIFWWESPKFEIVERKDIVAAQYYISQYLLNTMYYQEMNVEQLKSFAVFCLLETETVSDTVGGPLQIATVTLANGFQRLNEKEIKDLINENQPRFAHYRKSMLEIFSKFG